MGSSYSNVEQLATQQCMVLGLSVARGSEAGTASWAGGYRRPIAVYFARP
jgi:hypothetical protein